MKTQPRSAIVDLHVRLPEGIHAQLVAAAYASGRSLNSEVWVRLQRTFTQERQPTYRQSP